MFNFLKKIFEKEEPLQQEQVKTDQLGDWLEKKISQIDFQEEIIEFFNKIKDKKWVLEEKVDALEQAEIDEKEKEKIEEKVKSITLGHKDNYIREMRRFLKSLTVPPEHTLQGAINFTDFLNKELNSLAQKTAKSYQAAQHLFFNQVEEIFKVIGEINSLAKKFDQKLKKKDFDKLERIKQEIKLLQETKRREERIRDDFKWKEIKLKRSREGKQRQEEEIDKLKQSEEYDELKKLKEKEEEINSQIKENQDDIFLFFSNLGRALRKYKKVTLKVKIVQTYLKDAIQAFLNDRELKILDVLEGLRKSIEKGEVNLDQKQKDNAFKLIEKAKKGYLKEIQERANQLQEKVNKFKVKLRRYNIDKLIEEAEYKQEHFEEQIILVQRELEELKVKLQASGEEKIKESLKESIQEALKVKIDLI